MKEKDFAERYAEDLKDDLRYLLRQISEEYCYEIKLACERLKEKLEKPSVKEFETIKSEIKENCYEILAQLCWLSRVFYSYLDAYKEVIKNNGEEKTTGKTG